jgi:hypothetical protein
VPPPHAADQHDRCGSLHSSRAGCGRSTTEPAPDLTRGVAAPTILNLDGLFGGLLVGNGETTPLSDSTVIDKLQVRPLRAWATKASPRISHRCHRACITMLQRRPGHQHCRWAAKWWPLVKRHAGVGGGTRYARGPARQFCCSPTNLRPGERLRGRSGLVYLTPTLSLALNYSWFGFNSTSPTKRRQRDGEVRKEVDRPINTLPSQTYG